jgi:SAM-dependent methyltransferase
VGGSTPVIIAAEAHSGGRGKYFTINLNKKLAAELKRKIGHVAVGAGAGGATSRTPKMARFAPSRLRMNIRIIEDNAQRALAHLEPNSFDVACFHHAVNDILETAVSEPRGMDTTAVDWWPNERQMIEWLAEDHKSGLIEQRGKPELMQIISDAIRLVRSGGYLIFDHFNWCKFIGVDWFPWDLFYNLIPMTRRWVAEAKLPVAEVSLPGVDAQWWMILRVEK